MRFRTLRSLMILIALVAAALSAQRAFAKHQARIQRYETALKQYGLLKADYDVGRVTTETLLPASEELMNAEYALTHGRDARISAIKANVSRAAWVLKEEMSYHNAELEHQCDQEHFSQRFLLKAQARLAEEMAR